MNDFNVAVRRLGDVYVQAFRLRTLVSWLDTAITSALTRWQRARRWVVNLVRWR